MMMEQDRIEQIQARGLVRLCGKSPIPVRKTQAEIYQEYISNSMLYSYYYQTWTFAHVTNSI